MGPDGRNGTNGGNNANRGIPQITTSANHQDAFNSFKQFVMSNLVNSTKESDLRGFIDMLEQNNLFTVHENPLLEKLKNGYSEIELELFNRTQNFGN